ncbi:hypothetical protein CPB97_004039 [Podila verticillata]|nr:hypothetical protein CPB97_004039 [Podila verticillata]
MEYAMGGTAVSDHCKVFIYFSTGYVGSMHDSQAYKNTELFLSKDEYFQGMDYLLADAAYALSPTVIPRYKNATDDQDNDEDEEDDDDDDDHDGIARARRERQQGAEKREQLKIRVLQHFA